MGVLIHFGINENPTWSKVEQEVSRLSSGLGCSLRELPGRLQDSVSNSRAR